MGRITPRRAEPPAEAPPSPAGGAAAPAEPPRLGRGWRVALTLWVLAFGGLMLFELGNFLRSVLRGWF
jgi:hypothetical protein